MPYELVRTRPGDRLPAHVRRELQAIDHRLLTSIREVQGLDLLGRLAEVVVVNQADRQARAESPAAALGLAEVQQIVRLGTLNILTRFSMGI